MSGGGDIRSFYKPHQIRPKWSEKSDIDNETLHAFICYMREKNLVLCENIYKCTCISLQCEPVRVERGNYRCAKCAPRCSNCKDLTLDLHEDEDTGEVLCFSCINK